MAKSSDEIEREIALHRERLGWKLQHLQDRVQRDMRNLRETAQGEVDGKTDVLGRFDVEAQVREHPYSVLLGGLGLGVALGAASEGLAGGKGRHNGSGGQQHGAHSSGLFDGALAALSGVAGETIQTELRRFLNDGLASMKGQPR